VDGGHIADGDHWQGQREGHDSRWADAGRRHCPPVVQHCSADDRDPPGDDPAAVAGRDAHGYLTWPGKN
jgi:hypothetical protein